MTETDNITSQGLLLSAKLRIRLSYLQSHASLFAMVAQSSQEEQKRRRRGKLVKGLLAGRRSGGPAGPGQRADRPAQRAPGSCLPGDATTAMPGSTARSPFSAWAPASRCCFSTASVPVTTPKNGVPPRRFWPIEHLVYAPDLLGWGRSDKPRLAYDGELYIQLIGDFLEDVVAQRCTVVAAGLAAAYAVQIAIDRPELIESLALVVPSGIEIHGEEPDLKDALVNRLLRLPILGTSALNLFTSRTAIGQYLKREVFLGPERWMPPESSITTDRAINRDPTGPGRLSQRLSESPCPRGHPPFAGAPVDRLGKRGLRIRPSRPPICGYSRHPRPSWRSSRTAPTCRTSRSVPDSPSV